MHRLFCTSACLIALAAVIPAANAGSLRTSVGEALASHPSVEAASMRQQATEHDVDAARSAYFPELSITGQAGRVYSDNTTTRGLTVDRGAGYSWLGEGSVTMRQMLFDFFGASSRVDAAKARSTSAEYDAADVKEAIALRAVKAWLAVVRARDSLHLAHEYRQSLDTYIERIGVLIDNGAADISELSQARERRTNVEETLVSLNGQMQSAIASYREAIGHTPQTAQMSVPKIKKGSFPKTAAAALAQAKQAHPQLKAVDQEAAAYAHDGDAEWATFFPRFDGELSYMERDQRDVIGGEATDARAVVRMNWNFATGGEQLSRKRRAITMAEEARARKEETTRSIERDLHMAYNTIDTLDKRIGTLDKRLQLQTEIMDSYEMQFDAAKRSLLQLMMAEASLYETSLQRLGSAYDILETKFAVLASMGVLTSNLGLTDVPIMTSEAEPITINPAAQTPATPKPVAIKKQVVKVAPQDIEKISTSMRSKKSAEIVVIDSP